MRTAAALAAALALALALTAPAARAAPPAVESSPLAANGFESPSCATPSLASQLSAREQRNCAVSGVAVAPVPLSNYAVDINVASGLGASFHDDIDSIVQELFLTPVWTALVWLVHVVLIALEWCYSLDLLAPATLSRAAGALGAAKRLFTDPWLGLALAIAAVGFAWQGLVRRRVLDSAGRAALLALMVVGGLWIIANPTGTVGAVASLADRAALGTVAASATGDPSQPAASVDDALSTVFDAVISGPWCYLEFGDVEWCRDPAQLDPRLQTVGVRLEEIYRTGATCRGNPPALVRCAPPGSALAQQRAAVATALGEADSNGALFLALPPGSPFRTALVSAVTVPTLYQTLCGASDGTACTAPTGPQAEFRTASGTWSRVGGLLLIVAGALGMLLLFGFIAARLLGAALAALLYLLLAPLAVLAPALGDSGRDAFRLWLMRLLGALLAKLVYSVALGVVLLIVALLSSLDQLGWWTQWLLVSVFWWMAFEHRHRMLSLVLHERGEPVRRPPLATRVRLAAWAAVGGAAVARAPARAAFGVGATTHETIARWRSHQQGGSGDVPPPAATALAAHTARRERARAELRAQTGRVLAVERDEAGATGAAARTARAGGGSSTMPAARDALAARAMRIDQALSAARAAGERRRVISLEQRRQRVRAELAQGGAALRPTRAQAAGRSLARALPAPLARALVARSQGRALDRAARARPADLRRTPARAASLAPLAGLAPAAYTRAGPGEQRAARLEIDRQLSRRRELLAESRPAPVRVLDAVLPGSRRNTATSRSAETKLERRRRQFGDGRP